MESLTSEDLVPPAMPVGEEALIMDQCLIWFDAFPAKRLLDSKFQTLRVMQLTRTVRPCSCRVEPWRFVLCSCSFSCFDLRSRVFNFVLKEVTPIVLWMKSMKDA